MRWFFVFLLIGCKVFGQLQIHRLTDDAYVYTTYHDLDGKPFPSNSMYVVTDSGVVLIDTPWDEKQFQPLLDSVQKRHGKSVIMCIATHYHADCTAGLDYYKRKGIKTYSTKLTQRLCRENNEKVAEFGFAGDTIFKVGNKSLQAIFPGEGHTKDNIVVWVVESKILFGGCLVKSTESSGLGNIADANLSEWPKTIRKLMTRFPDAAHVIPGHFGWKENGALSHTLKLLTQKSR